MEKTEKFFKNYWMTILFFVLDGVLLNFFPQLYIMIPAAIALLALMFYETNKAIKKDEFIALKNNSTIETVYFTDGTYFRLPKYIIHVCTKYNKKKIAYLIKQGLLDNTDLRLMDVYNSKPKK